MSAVEDLHRHVEQQGYYTQADVDALRFCADAGLGAEKAAAIVLTAKRKGSNPLVLARHVVKLARAVRRST